MTNALKYKSISNWDKMIDELDMAYNQYLYDIDNTTTPLMWYYGLAYFNFKMITSLEEVTAFITCFIFKLD